MEMNWKSRCCLIARRNSQLLPAEVDLALLFRRMVLEAVRDSVLFPLPVHTLPGVALDPDPDNLSYMMGLQ